MSSWAAELRRREAARRREERASHRRLKERERLIKAQTKLSEQQQARMEELYEKQQARFAVEEHEDAIEDLLSIHKERGEQIFWAGYACALPPHVSLQAGRHELAAGLARGIAPRPATVYDHEAAVEKARLLDEDEHRQEQANYNGRVAEWRRLQVLAKRVLAGESQAYSEAIEEFSPFAEIASLGSSMHLTVYSPKLMGCVLVVHGREAIPAEAKSLTAAGKLSLKAMPRGRFHEIYQDHVCSCALRVARELFALLPVDTVLVTASVDGIDSRVGSRVNLPVLSVAFDRATVDRLDFERLDPSDAMENFVHRGDAKTSRKSGEFLPIVPLNPDDLMPVRPERTDLGKLLADVRQLRMEIGAKLKPVVAGNDEVLRAPQPLA